MKSKDIKLKIIRTRDDLDQMHDSEDMAWWKVEFHLGDWRFDIWSNFRMSSRAEIE